MMKTLLIFVALMCLFSTTFLSSATPAGSGIVLVPTIRVVRASRIDSWNDLKTDTSLRRVTQDVADYLEVHPIQMLDPIDLASYLGQNHDVTMSDNENYYMYVVGPDGVTHEICIPKPEIQINSETSKNPILVEIQWHVDFA